MRAIRSSWRRATTARAPTRWCSSTSRASSDARETILDVARRTAEEVFIPFTVGGGIRAVDDARRLLRAGADKVSVNTAAVDRPELVGELAAEFGAQCVVVAVDARRSAGRASGFGVFTHGGRRRDALDAVEWVRRVEALGAGEILLTSMDRDGTGDGFDLELTRAVSDAVNVPVALRRVGTLQHLVEGVTEGGAGAVLAASIFHFGEHTVGDAKGRAGRGRAHRPALAQGSVQPSGARRSDPRARPPGSRGPTGSGRLPGS